MPAACRNQLQGQSAKVPSFAKRLVQSEGASGKTLKNLRGGEVGMWLGTAKKGNALPFCDLVGH